MKTTVGPKANGRQALACSRCRRRKVKCDRTKPCSACCSSGRPTECHFVVSDGSDYVPIQQSQEIRELRLENKRLREQVLDTCVTPVEDYGRQGVSNRADSIAPRSTYSAKPLRVASSRTPERTPEGVTLLVELLTFTSVDDSWTTLSRPSVAYQAHGTSYQFPMASISDDTTAALTYLLPPRYEIHEKLEMFQRLLQTFTVHQPLDRMKVKSVDAFLDNIGENATNTPDMLALLFAVLSLVVQSSVRDRASRHKEDDIKILFARSECYVAASMQALRNASFMSKPTILSIKTLLVIGFYLTNSEQMQDAWSLFGLTVRLAHSIKLHRNPDSLDYNLSAHEKSVRRSLWWLMLYLDQHLSVAFAKPMAISNNGDCPPPIFCTTNPEERRLHQFVTEFTIVSRRILSSEGKLEKTAEYTDMLLQLWEMMPEVLRFKEAWVQTESARPHPPLDVVSTMVFARIQLLILLLNSQYIPWLRRTPSVSITTMQTHAELPIGFDESKISHRHADYLQTSGTWEAERRHVVRGCVQLLRAFHYLWQHRPTTRTYEVLDYEAYRAAIVLICVSRASKNQKCIQLIEQTRLVFVQMQHGGPNKHATLAVERITAGLDQLARAQGVAVSVHT